MIVSAKIPTKLFPGFLKSGQIKKIKGLYHVKQPLNNLTQLV